MPRRHPLYTWVQEIVTEFTGPISRTQATVLALYSFGVIAAQRSGLPSVAHALAPILGRCIPTVRSRLQEFYQPANVKSGRKRRELDVSTCFVPLLNWILKHWSTKQIALALDATTLTNRLVVLSISVVFRGSSIPVAWKVLHGNVKHAWNPEWLNLLYNFHLRLPSGWTVLALTDRGLYSRWLYCAITALHWHPLMRVNRTGKFRKHGAKSARLFWEFVPQPGCRWEGRGIAFPRKPDRRLTCTLLACWEPGQQEPWFVLTDLAPTHSEALWYGMRGWMEHGIKLFKSAGWQWHRSRMTDPVRAERLWLVLAVATRYVLAVGGEAEDGQIIVETIPELPPVAAKSSRPARRGPIRTRPRQRPKAVARPKPTRRRKQAERPARPRAATQRAGIRLSGTKQRDLSVFHRGLTMIVTLIMAGQALPEPHLRPEPWLEIRQRHHQSERQAPTPIARNPSL